MLTKSPRPFHLVDLMIVVAASGLGLALDRWIWWRPASYPMGTVPQSWGVGSWPASLWLRAPGGMAAALTVALVGLRWLGPRATWREVIRQPGAVASLATVAALVIGVGIKLVEGSIKRFDPASSWPIVVFENSFYWGWALRMVPPVLAGAWLALALSGQWSPERSWIDRLGIVLGVYWLMSYPVDKSGTLLNVLMPYGRGLGG